jgi:hypothetical protein
VGKRFVKFVNQGLAVPGARADGPIRGAFAQLASDPGSARPPSPQDPNSKPSYNTGSSTVKKPKFPEVRRRRKRGGNGLQLDDTHKQVYDEGQTKYIKMQVQKTEAGMEMASTAEENINKLMDHLSTTQMQIDESLKPKYEAWKISMDTVSHNVKAHSRAFLKGFHDAGVKGQTTLNNQYLANQKGLVDAQTMFTTSKEQLEANIEPIYTKWKGDADKYFAPETGKMAISTAEIAKQMKQWGESQFTKVNDLKANIIDSIKIAKKPG